jgi:hypothetical protein
MTPISFVGLDPFLDDLDRRRRGIHSGDSTRNSRKPDESRNPDHQELSSFAILSKGDHTSTSLETTILRRVLCNQLGTDQNRMPGWVTHASDYARLSHVVTSFRDGSTDQTGISRACRFWCRFRIPSHGAGELCSSRRSLPSVGVSPNAPVIHRKASKAYGESINKSRDKVM